MKFCTAFAILLCIIYVDTKNFVEEYCWRDFKGVIPIDALPAGVDKDGKSMYVGQVLFGDKLINGKILSGRNVVYFDCFFKELWSNKNVKILCSDQPQKFEWVETTHDLVSALMEEKIVVQGGYEEEVDTYIGRAQCGDEKVVGKVVPQPMDCYELFVTKDGYTKRYKVFELLTYNPRINSTDGCNFAIDVRNAV